MAEGRPYIFAKLVDSAGVSLLSGDVNNTASAAGFLDTLAVGRYNSTLPTLTNTQYNALQVGSRGAAHVQIMGADSTTGVGVESPIADGSSSAANFMRTAAHLKIFNGGSWDRVQGVSGSIYVNEGPFTISRKTADGQVKGSAGFVHNISIAPTTATPTAGLLTIYDSLTETGTILFSEWIFATTVGHTIILDGVFSTGLFVGYDATLANVSVTVTYR